MLESGISTLDSYFRYVSWFEVVMYAAQLMFMLARWNANSVAYCIVGLVHPARAVFGFLILRRIPDTDKIYS
jgi:hypothetical protein